MTLDFNEFNIKVHYYVDTAENAGTITLYFYNDFYQKITLGDQSIGSYSPSNVYPCEYTSEVRAWVPDPPSGSYRIRAEMWRHEWVPPQKGFKGGYYQSVEMIAVDEITITIPPKATDITDVPVTTPPVTQPVITDIPQTTTGIPPGAIYVSSNPGEADIWINGKYQVKTNSSIDNPFGFTDLAPGAYTVTLRTPGYIDYTEVVNLNSNEIYDVKAVMQAGITPTGWMLVSSDPTGTNIFINDKKIATAPVTITDLQPGTYNVKITKDSFEDWNDTISISAGQITEVNATLPPISGEFPIGAVAGGAAVLTAGGLIVRAVRGKGAKGIPPGPKTLYQEWWDKASPADRKNWTSFEKFLTGRLGSPWLPTYVDERGNLSWASAHTSWQQDVSKGETKSSFEDWVKDQTANQEMVNEMKARADANKNFRPKEIVEASEKYSEALRNKERLEHLTQIKKAVAGDSKLASFVSDVNDSIVKDGLVDKNKLNHLEGTLKRWIIRDKMLPQTPDYTEEDAFYDTARDFSGNVVVRLGAAYLTAGYSEMVLNPISAVSTMRASIMQGKSNFQAVKDGYTQAGFELALGESGRLVKYVKPLVTSAQDSYKMYKLGQVSANLKSEISTINQLAKQTEGQMTRNAFMKSSEVTKFGKTAAHELTNLEKEALKLNNNAEYRKLLAENSDLIPSKVKEVMGTAKQKIYEQARNEAINDVMNQMAKDRVPTGENPYFIRQVGTHAQPGNPGWNSLKSDFDHTVDFGKVKYNQSYETSFNKSLEAKGTSAKAMDANVYGDGTSSRGAYKGGAKKFVENYTETSGSDIMIRNEKGVTTITRETPQTSTSLLSKMDPTDVKSAEANYQDFFKKDLAKGGDINNQIVNGSKTVSRNAGQYSNQYVEHYQNTGSVSYDPPAAAKVADLIKKRGFSVDDAMQKAGYGGSKEQLLNDFKKIMGL